MEDKETCRDLQIKSVCALISEWTQKDQITLIRSLMLKSKVYSLYNVLPSPNDKDIRPLSIEEINFFNWISTCFPELSNRITHDFFKKAYELYDFIFNETKIIRRNWGNAIVSKCNPDGLRCNNTKDWSDILTYRTPKDVGVSGKIYQMSFFNLMLCINHSTNWEKDFDVILFLLDYKESEKHIYYTQKERTC